MCCTSGLFCKRFITYHPDDLLCEFILDYDKMMMEK